MALDPCCGQPAGGAQPGQLAALFGVYLGGTGGVLWLVTAHRAGRTRVLARAAAAAEWVFRVPGLGGAARDARGVGLLAAMWAGSGTSATTSTTGRDTGPLGNPGHWPLLLGVFTSFAGGLIGIGLADQSHASPAWVRLDAAAGGLRSAASCSSAA